MTSGLPCLVVVEDALGEGLVKHLAVPLLQSLGLGDLLVGGVTVEDVVVTLARGAGPDMRRHVPEEEVSALGFKSVPSVFRDSTIMTIYSIFSYLPHKLEIDIFQITNTF